MRNYLIREPKGEAVGITYTACCDLTYQEHIRPTIPTFLVRCVCPVHGEITSVPDVRRWVEVAPCDAHLGSVWQVKEPERQDVICVS